MSHVFLDLIFVCGQNYSSLSMCTPNLKSSFSRSRDIGVCVLIISALSAILDSTFSGFGNSPICRTLGPQLGKWISDLGGPSCTGFAADESAIHYCFRFLFFCPIFKSECSECEWSKNGQNFALFDPLCKIWGPGGDVYTSYSCQLYM